MHNLQASRHENGRCFDECLGAVFANVLLVRSEWFLRLHALGFEIDCDHFLELLFELLKHEEPADLPAARACLRFAHEQGVEWDERFCEVLSDACTLVGCCTCRPPPTRREKARRENERGKREKRERERDEKATKERIKKLKERIKQLKEAKEKMDEAKERKKRERGEKEKRERRRARKRAR